MAKVVAVNVSEKKGTIKHAVEEVEMKEDFGIVGDSHAEQGSIRQISLLGIESINKMKEYGIGLCVGKFAENVTTEGICLYELPVGTKLKIGETLHEVTQIGKKCHADEVRNLVEVNAGEGHLAGIGPQSADEGDYHVAEYLERIDLAFACADLIICRSGAGTVAELTALGLPAVYVPLPIGNGEQRFNAQPVVEAGGGMMVDDAELTPAWVRKHIPALLNDTDALRAMGGKAWEYGIRDAADTMARRILDLADRHTV